MKQVKHRKKVVRNVAGVLLLLGLCLPINIFGSGLDDILNDAQRDRREGDRWQGDVPKGQVESLKSLGRSSRSGKMELALDAENKTLEFLKLELVPPSSLKSVDGQIDYIAVARDFLSDNSKALNLDNPENELQVVSLQMDAVQNRHVRFQQTHNGLPVWSKEALVHMKSDGGIFYFNGRYRPTITDRKGLEGLPSLSEKEAESVIYKDLGVYEVTVNSRELMVYAEETPRLVYRYDISIGFDQHWEYLIDAHNGEVVNRIDQIHTNAKVVQASGLDGKGVMRTFNAVSMDDEYYMLDPTTPKKTRQEEKSLRLETEPSLDVLKYFKDEPPDSFFTIVRDLKNKTDGTFHTVKSSNQKNGWDKYAVSAMNNSLITQRYYWDKFKRSGLDGKGGAMESVIHYGKNENNAFFFKGMMFYGDGDGENLSNLATCLDVAAHEMTHGVIRHTANLVYQFQSGALNESFADVFASMVDREDWLLGEDCTVAEPGFIRSMKDPHRSLGKQPKKMSEYQKLSKENDHGGVHVNSGIPNHAAYLTTQVIGYDKTEQIYYQALSHYLLRSSKFIDARRGLIQAAVDIHGEGSEEVTAVETVWDMVEVFDKKERKRDKPPGGAGDGSVGESELWRELYDVLEM